MRVGMFNYTDQWWDAFVSDPEHWREGSSELFHVVVESNNATEGIVSYRIRNQKEVIVILRLGTTAAAEPALWRHCFGIDLKDSISASNRPLDDPLPMLLEDAQRLEHSVKDGLWLRLIDVSRALSNRGYASECHIVLRVRDLLCDWNDGCIDIETNAAGAICTPTSKSPDVELSVSNLASIYLGGTTLATLLRAGRIEERKTGSVRNFDRALATLQYPWTPEF